MPEVQISCVSPGVRDSLLDIIRLVADDEEMAAAAKDLLEELPDCKDGQIVGFNITDSLKKRRKRAPSEYNKFIGSCMTGGVRSLTDCAADWRAAKERGNAR